MGDIVYFIPRNNKFYNYIAHTDIKRCYLATLFVLGIIGIIGFYAIYKPLLAHIMLYKTELIHVQKQYEQGQQLEKSNSELSALIDTNKKNLATHIIPHAEQEEWCNKHMQFIFDLITQSHLTLKSYGPCTEKDKKWYIKDSAPYQVTGSLENILEFLKNIRESNKMIIASHVNVTRLQNNLFQLNCDMGIITVKK